MTIRKFFAVAARQPGPATGSRAPSGFPVGRVLISAVAVFTPLGAFAADWNATHIYNPDWPPHAKFHNAQTMVSAVLLPALALWQLWGRRPADRSALRLGALLAAAYFVTQAPAVLFPGAEVVDPEFRDELPVVAGVELNVLYAQAVLFYPAIAAGYALESRRLRRAGL
jgi:hypothetical protein